ncbi:MAG: FAD-dependent oxidoreductase [Alphaproteobacteria bacterium]|nr:FAD-dependent oxidoreductase [Alphaproteobacteria bacterium]
MTITPQNIAIIGAGIMGLSNAFALLQDGHRITLYDPAGFPADNASFIAGGMLAPFSEIEHMPASWIEAGLESINLWQEIAATLPAPIDFHKTGSLFVAHKEDLHILERFASHLKSQKSCRRVGREEINALEPHLNGRFTTGLYLENEAYLYPSQTMQALCDDLRGQGAQMKQEWADPAILDQQYDIVLDCRGHSAENTDSNLRGVKGEIVLARNPEFSLSRPVRLMHPRYPLYIVPRPDHVFMIGATNIEGAGGEHVSLRSAMELMSALYTLHPSFGDAQIIALHSGIRPSYEDNLPRITVRGNIIACNGLFRHGFLLSPFLSECVRKHIAGEKDNLHTSFVSIENEDHDQRTRKNLRGAA